MKSRKEIARLANELTQALEQSTDDKVFLKIVAYGKDALTKRQIAPQVIMEKMGGGGHFSMAACQLQDMEVEEVKALLIQKLDEYYEERED